VLANVKQAYVLFLIPRKFGKTLDKDGSACYTLCTIKLGIRGVMDSKTILEAARNNKVRGQEYETKASVKSNLLGSAVAIVVGIILFWIEYFIKDSANISLIAVGMTAACVQSLYEGIKLRKAYLMVIGCIELLVVIFSLVVFLSQVVS
jgi:hypothetical protein